MSKKKKRKGSKSRSHSRHGGPESAFADRRALEAGLSDIGRLLEAQDFETQAELKAFLDDMLTGRSIDDLASLAPAANTPVDQAQDLMYKAWNARGASRVRLARKALALSPDCADAYVLLAEETAKSVEEARDLYEQGTQAGERALGPKVFEEDAGHFWGLTETRPYMRARLGLAQCLWTLGQHEEAIGHYVDMLRLNPNDNQGIRWTLVNCLLQTGDDVAAGELLARFEEDASATWAYSQALYRFRRGHLIRAAAAIGTAFETNPFVPPYLLGEKRLPRRLPEYVMFGDETEAQSYAAEALPIWRKTPGAVDWLREAVSMNAKLFG